MAKWTKEMMLRVTGDPRPSTRSLDSGKRVLLWLRGSKRDWKVKLDEAPFSVQARSAAEEVIRLHGGVGEALKAGGCPESINAVAGANGLSLEVARKLLGF